MINITVKPLTPELAADFFDFFDNRAFSDNSPEGPCYCTRFQMTKEQEKAELFDQVDACGGGNVGFMRVLRKIAGHQIESGALKGYLAFVDGVAIGWCNANDRANFPAESGNGARFYAPAEKREKVVACFEIDPNFRGKGVATALLQKVIDDAKAEGYIAVEGFPVKRGERYEWDFTGPIRLYEKAGFTKVAERDGSVVMRKMIISR
ncbi:MAG: GNAT family N-acetyltransferase [Clostridiales bacterium]|jgi:GNAT superfamily N-acetyltransferase|nr:GNAT family N-acetyltransferase [Clostridiales bacterium]